MAQSTTSIKDRVKDYKKQYYLNTRSNIATVMIQRGTAVMIQTVTGKTKLSLSGKLSATVCDTGDSVQTVRLDTVPMLTVLP